MRMKCNGAFSNRSTVTNGVKQGIYLSQLLFNVYLDELLLTLESHWLY